MFKWLRNLLKEDTFPPYNVRMKRYSYKVHYSVLAPTLVKYNCTYKFYAYSNRFDDNKVKSDIAKQWRVDAEYIKLNEVENHYGNC